MTSSRSLKVVSLVAFSAVLGFAFPMNVTPTFLLSEHDKRVLTQHLGPPTDIPVDTHAGAPSAPVRPVAVAPVRSAPRVAQQPSAQPVIEEPAPVGSYRMRDQKIARVIAKQERARN